LIPALIGELQSTRELRDELAITLLRAILVELKRVVSSEVTDTATYSPSEQRVKELITRLCLFTVMAGANFHQQSPEIGKI